MARNLAARVSTGVQRVLIEQLNWAFPFIQSAWAMARIEAISSNWQKAQTHVIMNRLSLKNLVLSTPNWRNYSAVNISSRWKALFQAMAQPIILPCKPIPRAARVILQKAVSALRYLCRLSASRKAHFQ